MLKNQKWVPYATAAAIFFTFFGESLWDKYGPYANRYGAKYNDERHRLGILPLPEDWTTPNRSERKNWFPPDAQKKDSVFRSMKYVNVEDGEIINEVDNILRKGKGGNDAISIFYFYDSTNHWKYEFSSPGLSHQINLTAAQADSILHAWNFNSYSIKK
ncbi:hypothetical protein [Chitinophaga pinensis]|uniref:Uncharacterized protein n=1 Tax=Chitinophaga pinensis TaxID=79329 RepID=A0A5C6LL58_9BACT|nr:hypothetical protein [Chitinophaga pinensis]TWV93665.1 hypothetical protein FEF09_26550 [Chitinophaga pinensis]